MKWLLIAGVILACLIVIVYLIGLALPVKHSATVEGIVAASPDKVWNRITDVPHFTAWRKKLDSVEVVDATEWVEVSGHQKLPMKIVEAAPPTRLVSRINSRDLPFGGEWS